MKNGDEHRRNILKEIFGVGVFEKRCVLLQFVCDLVNNETAMRRERIVGFPKKRTFLFDLQNAKGNARKNVIALGEPAPFQLVRQSGSVAMYHVHSRIVRKLPLQITR